MKFHRFIAVLLCGLLAAAVRGADVTLTFLHINDTHGVGVTPSPTGGCSLARAAAVIRAVRAACPSNSVFLTIGGDIGLHGHDNDLLSQRQRGGAEIQVFNRLGVDLMVPGNHEFDRGADYARQMMEASAFPWLTGNLMLEGSTNRHFGAASAVFERRGVNVAFAGVSPGPQHAWHPAAAADLDIASPLAVASNICGRLRQEADLVVVLSHIGLESDILMAASAAPHLILGGHSHSECPGRTVGRTRILQARWHYEFVGRADVTLSDDDGAWRVTSITSTLLPTQNMPDDPDTLSFLRRLAAESDGAAAAMPGR